MNSRLCGWLSIAVLSFAGLTVFFGNLRFGCDAIGAGLEDDFYYYAQVAHNIAFFGNSTFDGTHLTNGYHPLWLIVLVACSKLLPVNDARDASAIIPFTAMLEAIQYVMLFAASYFAYCICRLLCTVYVSCGLLMLVATLDLIQLRTGMETGLAISLAFGLLWFRLRPDFRWTARDTVTYGFLASLLVLSRLDSILLIGLLYLLDILPRQRRLLLASQFTAGASLIAVYLAVNKYKFGTFLPVSGQAKQLRSHHSPSVHALVSFASQIFNVHWPTYSACFVAVLLAALLMICGRCRPLMAGEGVCWAVLIFPFLHLLTISALSDWQVWPWYLYTWPIAGLLAGALLLRQTPLQAINPARTSRIFLFASALLLAVSASALSWSSNPANNFSYQAAIEIRNFADHHPGTYAMGDRSGAVGYIARIPIVQLEGLEMDEEFLNNIRKQRDLAQVLNAYHVRYYISTHNTTDEYGCYFIREPYQAGSDSPFMQTRICRRPVAVLRHGSVVDYIFDLQ